MAENQLFHPLKGLGYVNSIPKPNRTVDGITQDHLGLDIVTPIGTPIVPTRDGKLFFMGNRTGFGKTVIIQYGKDDDPDKTFARSGILKSKFFFLRYLN